MKSKTLIKILVFCTTLLGAYLGRQVLVIIDIKIKLLSSSQATGVFLIFFSSFFSFGLQFLCQTKFRHMFWPHVLLSFFSFHPLI